MRYSTHVNTKPSLNGSGRDHQHSRSGESSFFTPQGLRWTAAGMLEAERQFRRIIGYRDLATLAVAIERDLNRRRAAQATIKEPAIVATV
jgi:hypothetical protein